MKIIADENIPLVHEVFDGLGEVRTFPGRAINAGHVRDADVLLVRSVTNVDGRLLKDSSVKFVGTCTIGTDHIDLTYLDAQQIGFSAAPGCNAHGVVDYVLSVLVVLARQQGFDLRDRCVGVVGVGNVGQRLKARLGALGVRCLCNDPLHDDEDIPGLVHLDELIREADVISLHTPLTTEGDHPTYHLFNAANLALLKPNCVLINSARGSVVDNRALINLLEQRPDITAALDVWEGEPDISLALVDKVALATPHIAGYSLDGKISGTRMVYEALCRHFCLSTTLDVDALAPAARVLQTDLVDSEAIFEEALGLLLQCYDVRRDDRAFREVMVAENADRSSSFDLLRKNYPVRREMGATAVKAASKSEALQSVLNALGFKYPADT